MAPYVAGLFDGEGCVFAFSPTCIVVQVSISNNDFDILDKLQHQFGGGITVTNQGRGGKWYLSRLNQIESFLRFIQPFCFIKKELIDQTLQWMQNRQNWNLLKALLEKDGRIQNSAYQLAKIKCQVENNE